MKRRSRYTKAKTHKRNVWLEAAILALCVSMLIWSPPGLKFVLIYPKSGQQQDDAYEDIKINVYDVKSEKTIQMELEDYITGVVSAEMPSSYESAALMAQAVAARTYAYRKMTESPCGRGGADVCTDSAHCQAYNSLEERKAKWGDSFEKNEEKVEAAVQATRGEIITYGGEPILALFHSTSGGMTEDVANVYGESLPYLKSVESDGEEGSAHYERTVSFTVAEFVSRIKKENSSSKITKTTVAKSVGEATRFDSGRVDTIKIGGVSFTGKKIREIFDLDSTNFTMEVKDDRVYMTTKGYGHGVGMSQVGANAMAKEGADCSAIILHYYTGVQISDISNLSK